MAKVIHVMPGGIGSYKFEVTLLFIFTVYALVWLPFTVPVYLFKTSK